MPTSDQYQVKYVAWCSKTCKEGAESIAWFMSLEQIEAWIRRCKVTGIRINVLSLEHSRVTVTQSPWVCMEAEKVYLQTQTGQMGIPTTQINLRRRKKG